jgi:DNA-directed RNA polymerase sigma subunit (sigma70/sigma32)
MRFDAKKGYSKDDIEHTIDKYVNMHLNAERNRAILKRRLIDGLTHEQLAEEFDLSTQSIQKILYKYEQVVFNHLP